MLDTAAKILIVESKSTPLYNRRPDMKDARMMVKSKTRSNGLATAGVGTETLQGAVVGLGAMAAGLVGVWALSCLVAAVITAGGPVALVVGWFGAVTGI